MDTKIKKPRIRAIPQKGSGLITAASILLILAGASMLLFRLVFSETGDINALFPSLIAVLLLIAGVLLLFCRERSALFIVFCLLLIWIMHSVFGYLPAVAVLLMLLSAIGWRFNIVPGRLPRRLGRPILNLLAAAVSIVSILNRADSSRRLYVGNLEIEPTAALILVVFAVLPLVSLLMINLAMEPREAVKGTRREFRIKSVPPESGGLFSVAAWTLIIAGAGFFIVNFVNYILYASALRIPVFDALLVWAGLLLVRRNERNARLTAAVILIAMNLVYFHFNAMPGLFTLVLPAVLMLISAAGTTWNATPHFLSKKRRTPLLNILAAILFLVHLVITVYGLISNAGMKWYGVVLTILQPLGLMLLNLSLGSAEIARKNVDRKYRRGFAGLIQRIYGNVGSGLQTLARVVGIFFLCVAVLSVVILALGVVDLVLFYVGEIYLIGSRMLLIAGGIGLGGSIIMIFGTWPLFAYGQIASDVRELKNGGGAPEYFEENPDNLPEL